ncbi:MAG: hypothetical protein KME54_16905 [Tolypothrix brevis GSE-NOS-MK-07-07A]|nr:hypothetical protein [Tolypothrix brevis GSE-NOS-MK-07-07A]
MACKSGLAKRSLCNRQVSAKSQEERLRQCDRLPKFYRKIGSKAPSFYDGFLLIDLDSLRISSRRTSV